MVKNFKKSSFNKEISGQFDFSGLFGSFFIIIFIFCSIYGGKYLLNPNTLPIKHVKVDGNFNRLSQADLKNNVVSNIQGGFFNLNVDEVLPDAISITNNDQPLILTELAGLIIKSSYIWNSGKFLLDKSNKSFKND